MLRTSLHTSSWLNKWDMGWNLKEHSNRIWQGGPRCITNLCSTSIMYRGEARSRCQISHSCCQTKTLRGSWSLCHLLPRDRETFIHREHRGARFKASSSRYKIVHLAKFTSKNTNQWAQIRGEVIINQWLEPALNQMNRTTTSVNFLLRN